MKEANATAYNHYDMTVAMLNKTMGICLRWDYLRLPQVYAKKSNPLSPGLASETCGSWSSWNTDTQISSSQTKKNRGTDAYFAIKGLKYYRSSSSGSSSRRRKRPVHQLYYVHEAQGVVWLMADLGRNNRQNYLHTFWLGHSQFPERRDLK